MFIQIIDRYIAKLFIAFFIGGLVVFLTLFTAIDIMTNISRFDATATAILDYYTYYMPGIAYTMVPVACLMGTVFTLSTLNRNNELVALFSSGMSLARISAPILSLVVVISGLSFWLGDRVLPYLTQKKNYVYHVEIRKRPGSYATVKTNRIWYRTHNILYNIKTLQPERSEAQGLTMYYFDSTWHLIQMITAGKVALKGETWDLSNGSVTVFERDTNIPLTQDFAEKTISMGQDAADLQSTSQPSEILSLSELRKFIERNKEAGLDTLRYEVDYHSKFGFAFAAFVMSFIGIPFSVTRARSGGTAFNIGLCVGLAFLYWTGYNSSLTLGQHGVIPPLIAAWAPNLAVLALSVFLLIRMKR